MAWRLVVVVQYDPPSMEVAAAMVGEGDPPSENLHGRVRVRERYFYHAAGDGSAAYGTGSVGPAGSDTPIMRLVDRNLDGDFTDYAEQQYFLANWRGDITAIMTPNSVAGQPGIVLARVRYDAYGKPMMYHPADFDRDGLVGGSLSTEYTGVVNGDQHDYGPFEDVLALAPFSGSTPGTVDAKLRAWRAWVNIANLPPPSVAAFPSQQWDDWKDDLRDAREAFAISLFTNNLIPAPSDEVRWQELFGNLPLYAGYWWDAKLELYHVRHRVYDPVAGRWLQRDPIGYAGGNNLYGYGPNSPHVGSDPMGLYWEETAADLNQGGTTAIAYLVGVVGAISEQAIDSTANLVLGFTESVAQAVLNVWDTGGLAVEAATDGAYTHRAQGEMAKRYLEGTHDVAQETANIGIRGATAIATLGVSEIVASLVVYYQTGDDVALSKAMGAVAGGNLLMARGIARAQQRASLTQRLPAGRELPAGVYERWMSEAELKFVQETNTLSRGGRPGAIYATTEVLLNAAEAQKKLALPQKSMIRVEPIPKPL